MSEIAPAEARRSVAGFQDGVTGVIPPAKPDRRGSFLSDVIIELGLSDSATVEEAVQAARQPGMTVGEVLVQTGALSEEQLALATAERNGCDYVDLDQFEVDMEAAALVSRSAAGRYGAVPIAFAPDGALIVAVEDPVDGLAISDIEVMTKNEARGVVASPGAIAAIVEQLPERAAPAGRPPAVKAEADAAPARPEPLPPEPPADVQLNTVPEEEEEEVVAAEADAPATVQPADDREQLLQEVERLKAELAETEDRLKTSSGKLSTAVQERDGLQENLTKVLAERDRLSEELAGTRGERDRAREELAETAAERDKLAEQLADSFAGRDFILNEARRLSDELKRLQSDSDSDGDGDEG